jgi:OOP family OmpA-OmpF porin
MRFASFWMYILCLVSTSVVAQENPWSIGIQSGYSALGSVRSVSVSNSFPVEVSLRYQINDIWSAKAEYQWIKSEQTNANSAVFQTFRSSTGYRFFNLHTHAFNFEMGLGYQFTNLEGVDQLRQTELSMGPTWSWQVFQQWHLETNAKYGRSFDRFLSTSFQRFEIGLGIAFHFGEFHRTYATKTNRTFLDTDQDGVHDQNDECSATPFGMKVAKNGCALDGDADLVVDFNDYCPNTKRGTDVDEMGCPLYAAGRGVIDGIAFEYNSPRLTHSSKNELEKVALTLKNYPDIFFVIEGYSTARTSPSERLNISKARAITVMNILASHGIPTTKMKAIGLSDQYPLTDSTNQTDQILNERIEIKWKHQL